MKLLEKPEVDQGTNVHGLADGTEVLDAQAPVDLQEEFAASDAAESGKAMKGALQVLLDQEENIERLEAKLKEATQARGVAEKAVIDKMLEQGLESFRALGKTVTRTERVYPSVLKDDREKQMEWLREIGMGALIQPTVNTNSFAGLIRKDFIEAKREAELPEFVKIYKEPRLAIRAVTK